uniref:Matrix-remodeling-associated protein 7 helical domain-containing protein n=1 Tax=Parastrongyloides trichosuri TaxID=131310 RepID=A0A0N5A4P8_PARTI
MLFSQFLEEPHFYWILLLTFIAAVSISFLSYKVINSPKRTKETLSNEEIVVKPKPNRLLKGSFNRSIPINKNKNIDIKMSEKEEKNDICETTSMLKEVSSDDGSIKDIIIDEKDIKFEEKKNELNPLEEAQLVNDVFLNNIAETSETMDLFSKMGELHGKLATAKTRIEARNFEKSLTKEEKEQEEIVKQKQLKEIFDMLSSQEEKFGIHSKNELEEQFKFYAI